MLENELEALLKDILVIQQMDGFGSEFGLALVEADRYDKLVLHVRGGDGSVRRMLVAFTEYPAQAAPEVCAKNPADTDATALAESAYNRLTQSNQPITLPMVLAALRQPAPTAISEIVMAKGLRTQILRDYKQYRPNEYAFLCSGTIEDGVGTVTNYYAGEMAVSTLVYCELTPEFIERTIYDEMPREHNLLVWSHVHPIEGPSGTDVESFRELAKWDAELAQAGGLHKRSIALLVSSLTKRLSFYDVHSLRKISHSEVEL